MVRDDDREPYNIFNRGLELKLAGTSGDDEANKLLLIAAEQFEQRAKCSPATAIRDRCLAALGYYLSGHYAQAYVLFRNETEVPDPRTGYSLLRQLFAKELTDLHRNGTALLQSREYTDAGIAGDLRSGEITQEQAIERMLLGTLHRIFTNACEFVWTGEMYKLDSALGLLDICYRVVTEAPFSQNSVYAALVQGTIAIFRELRDNSLWTRLHEMLQGDNTGYVRRYIEQASHRSPPLVELWPSQAVAIPVINEGQPGSRPNFLVKMPTSAGKTNVAELSFLRYFVDGDQKQRKCIYIAPFNAIGAQVEARLRRHFVPLGIGVSTLYGGFEVNPTDKFLFHQQRILVATPEKIDALLRYQPDFASQIGTVFIDEGHIIGDADRGMRTEMLIHRLLRRYTDGDVRVILASALLGSTKDLTQWFGSASVPCLMVASSYRPTRNFLGLLIWDGQKITRKITHVSDEDTASYLLKTKAPNDVRISSLPLLKKSCLGTTHAQQQALLIQDDDKNNTSVHREKTRRSGVAKRTPPKYKPLAFAALREAREGMTLVFVPRIDWLESLVETVLCAQHCEGYSLQGPPVDESTQLRLDQCIEVAIELTGENSLITRALRAGVAVHYGGVPGRLRTVLEPLIEGGAFNLVVATNTIMAGVNTPAKTVIIHSLVRGSPGDWKRKISSHEFFNLVGRAGRAMQETEGLALLFTEAEKEGEAQRTIIDLVNRINSEELKSSLGRFLQRVADDWRQHYPGTDVGELCEALASDRIDWLNEDAQHELADLDRELLALLQELEIADTSPGQVEQLFERSLAVLQAAEASDSWYDQQTSLRLLAARFEYLQKIPPAVRYKYYRTGLPIRDCEVFDQSADALVQRLSTVGQVADFSAQEVADFVWRLYADFLCKLSIFNKMKLLPLCSQKLLQGWLGGMSIDEIAEQSEVRATGMGRSEVTDFVEEFCGTYLPWALNAVRGYVSSVAPDSVVDDWLTKWSAMIHYGLPSPKAAIFYTLGLTSRKAAIWCADVCTERARSDQLLAWLSKLTDGEIEQWQTSEEVKREVKVLRRHLVQGALANPSANRDERP